MDQRYRILFTGQLQSGADVEEVVERLVVTFKIPAAQARLLVRDGNRHLIKKDLDEADAQRYRAVLEKAGMIVQVESMEPSAKTPTQAPLEGEPAEVTASPKPVRCRACGSTRMEDGVCRDCGVVREKYVARQLASSDQSIHQNGLASEGSDPYSTPRADLSPQPREGKMRGPYRVPAGHGWSWIARGFWHFKVNSLAWILAFLVLLGISIVLSLIPLIGGLANSLLAAVFIAGLMYGSREQEQGGDFRVEHLVAGFRENLGPLALVGLLYLVGSVLIGIVILVLLLGSMMPMLDMSPAALEAQDAATLLQMLGPMGMIALLVASLLLIPLLMAFLFAPALVMLEGLSATEAMKQSFVGCLKNVLPFLVYGLAALVLLILAIIPLGLGLLVVWPTLTAAIYVAYRDIYFP
jgi:hypothetical protein